ncbi:hypothetical protein [Ligilactobacillus equi]|uniref:Uncharacterized protein n=1 Tax=Ligilactobacillus equi DPC 6820 TaxID=1392007 RepID=V7HXX0_9LACO|nr:hypothetical protein [Ligilactobacillus equi]ETA74063.1 hypothetical protein LEQ_1523c [Ligilactobacillus equi DPC 6820]
MGFSIRQKELYMLVLEKSKEGGQIPLYAVTELMETNPEIFTGLKLQRVIGAAEEVEKFWRLRP